MSAFSQALSFSIMSNLSERERVLEDCLTVVASVIVHNGQAFWPIYSLLEEELEEIRSRKQKLENRLSKISPSGSKLQLESVI